MRRLISLAYLLAPCLVVPCLLALGGCAVPSPQTSQAEAPTYVVFFSEWSAAIDTPSLGTIANAGKAAKAKPQATVTVIGYADPAGSPQANSYMSQTRAQVVTDQLVRDGVAPSRILHAGRGPTDFSASAQESRRVQIDIGG